MADIFGDNPPNGYERNRKNKGWLGITQTPAIKKAAKLAQENAELKSRLEQLESMVEQLVSKKKK